MTVFAAGFLYIFLLGIQQQNITHALHGWSFVTCMLLSLVFALLVRNAVTADLTLFVLQYGLGSALGASLSIIIHRRWIHRRRDGVIGESL